MDDFSSDTSTTGAIAVGGSVQGVLETVTDRDWFAITLEAGKTYQFTLAGIGADEVRDPWLELRDGSGGFLVRDDDSGPGFDSLLVHDATATGTYYLEARSFGFGYDGDYILGANVLESIAGTDGPESLVGTAGNDRIIALGGNDTLAGLAGNDTLSGGSGRDLATYAGATASVVVDLEGSASGGAGNDVLLDIEDATGSDHADEIWGNAAGNHLAGGAGGDNIGGRSGDDTVLGGGGDDYLGGHEGLDLLEGSDGADTLDGRDFAGTEADTLDGGAGDDGYLADAADIIVEAVDGGHDKVYASGTFTLEENVEDLDLILGGNDHGIGNALANNIDGIGGHDTLQGLGGDDMLEGRRGDDSLAGDDGADLLVGGVGDDTLSGGDGNDTLMGNDGADSMAGGAGDDLYQVSSASDTLVEVDGEGLDTVRTQVDLTLADGVENLELQMMAQRGTGNGLDNHIQGSFFANLLQGMGGDDTLSGNSSDDTLEGGDGNDLLQGGMGTDVIDGGAGDDLLRGGRDADLFTFASGSGVDRIAEFSVAEGDRIHLDVGLNASGISDADDALAAASQVGRDTVIDLGGGNEVTLAGVRLADLTTASFDIT